MPDDRFEKISVVTANKRERQRLKKFGGARELVQYLARSDYEYVLYFSIL